MNARHLMAYLTLQGFVLSAADDDLVVHPASKLSDADRRSIRDRKTALLALLADQAGAAAAVAMVEPLPQWPVARGASPEKPGAAACHHRPPTPGRA